MIFWGSDFLRFLLLPVHVVRHQFGNLIIESETSKPTSLTNPYNQITPSYKSLQFFLGETQINRILAPCLTGLFWVNPSNSTHWSTKSGQKLIVAGAQNKVGFFHCWVVTTKSCPWKIFYPKSAVFCFSWNE